MTDALKPKPPRLGEALGGLSSVTADQRTSVSLTPILFSTTCATLVKSCILWLSVGRDQTLATDGLNSPPLPGEPIKAATSGLNPEDGLAARRGVVSSRKLGKCDMTPGS